MSALDLPDDLLYIYDDGEDTLKCKELWLRVVEQATQDLDLNGKKDEVRAARNDAKRWFLSDRGTWPGGFLWVCELFNWEPDNIRARLGEKLR